MPTEFEPTSSTSTNCVRTSRNQLLSMPKDFQVNEHKNSVGDFLCFQYVAAASFQKSFDRHFPDFSRINGNKNRNIISWDTATFAVSTPRAKIKRPKTGKCSFTSWTLALTSFCNSFLRWIFFFSSILFKWDRIGDFRVAFRLCFKARHSVKPFRGNQILVIYM